MLKSFLFLMFCFALALMAWGAFQVLGQYAFSLMLVITFLVLLANIGKPKFGGKNKTKSQK